MMSIITNGLKVLAFGMLLATTHAHATDITVGGSVVSVDDRVSAGDMSAHGGSQYDIDQMDVKWSSDNTITVDIFTNFANLSFGNGSKNYNNRNKYYERNIVFGDLMIGVDSGSSFNYAFSLGDMRYEKRAFTNSNSGGLYEIDYAFYSSQWHSGANRHGVVSAYTWGRNELGSNNLLSVGDGKISFSFNVSGIRAFQNASQVAFSWAMTCANDVVTGIANSSSTVFL